MSEEKGIWTAEAWKTPELLVVVNTGKETKKENINRSSVRDATIFDVVTQHLGLMKGTKTIVVEVDGKVMKPLEAQKIAASSVMEIVIHPDPLLATIKKVVGADRKYHQHRGIVGGHKLSDKHKDPRTQQYHDSEIIIQNKEA